MSNCIEERPVPLRQLFKMFPDENRGRIYRLTLTDRVNAIWSHQSRAGNCRQAVYLPSEVKAALRLNIRREEDRKGFTENGVEWVPASSESKQRRIIVVGSAESGTPITIDPRLANNFAAAGLTRASRVERFEKWPARVRFWDRAGLKREVLRCAGCDEVRPRSIEQLRALPPATKVGMAEAKVIGFITGFLQQHSRLVEIIEGKEIERRFPKSELKPTPDPALGRLFNCTLQPRVSAKNRLVREPMWTIGELLESWDMRGKAFMETDGKREPLPDGGMLLEVAAEEWGLRKKAIRYLIRERRIEERICAWIDASGSLKASVYLLPADREKLPGWLLRGTSPVSTSGTCSGRRTSGPDVRFALNESDAGHRPGRAAADSSHFEPEQIEAMLRELERHLRYLNNLCSRMEKLRFPDDDPLWQEAHAAKLAAQRVFDAARLAGQRRSREVSGGS
jgi:hypothetical protein